MDTTPYLTAGLRQALRTKASELAHLCNILDEKLPYISAYDLYDLSTDIASKDKEIQELSDELYKLLNKLLK
jgi:hypothetical protein